MPSTDDIRDYLYAEIRCSVVHAATVADVPRVAPQQIRAAVERLLADYARRGVRICL